MPSYKRKQRNRAPWVCLPYRSKITKKLERAADKRYSEALARGEVQRAYRAAKKAGRLVSTQTHTQLR